jgi:hypothetical protein
MMAVLPHLISNLAGLIIPPAFHILKQKICPTSNTPEAVLGTLATTKPEVLGDYVKATAELLIAKKNYFNRDVVGEVSLWVCNLRASIRPIYIAFGIAYITLITLLSIKGVPAMIYSFEITASSWFGTKIYK